MPRGDLSRFVLGKGARVKKRVVGRLVRASGEDVKRVVKRVATSAPRPTHCRTFARKRVAEVLPRIVERFAQEAMQGSVAHAKALMTLGGLDRGEVQPAVKPRRRKSFAKLLMERLEKDRLREPGSEDGSAEE